MTNDEIKSTLDDFAALRISSRQLAPMLSENPGLMAAFRVQYAPATPAPVPEVVTTETDYKIAFDKLCDQVAQQKQYDNRLTIAAYVGSSNSQWAAEAQAFVTWRDTALAKMFADLAAYQAGGSLPTVFAFLAGLPVISWPT